MLTAERGAPPRTDQKYQGEVWAMARINVETRALAENRFTDLMADLGWDKTRTIGLLVLLWHDSQEREIVEADRLSIEKFLAVTKGERAKTFDALLANDYLTKNSNGLFEIRGNRKHGEFLRRQRALGSLGGKSKASKRSLSGTTPLAKPPNAIQCNAIQEEEKIAPNDPPDRFAAVGAYASLSPVFLERKVTQEVQRRWQAAFPDSEWVVTSIQKALAWEAAHPNRRKKNFAAFMTNWMTRDWDKRRGITASGQPAKAWIMTGGGNGN